jgi:hypothetical protein
MRSSTDNRLLDREEVNLGLILLIILIVLLLGGLPAWPYSRGWGYGPSGLLTLVLIVLLILLFTGFVPWGYHWGPAP